MKYRKSTEGDPSPAKEAEVVKGLEVLGGSHLGLEGRVTTGTTQEEGKAEVGTVIIAIATPNLVFSEAFDFGQPREKVIDRTVNKAFELLQKELLKNL